MLQNVTNLLEGSHFEIRGSILKTLIAYCTRYGATASTSEEIAKILRGEGFEVDVIFLKKDKVKDITKYDLVIIGAGMQVMRWCGESEKFLNKFQEKLREKNTAIFVSSGTRAVFEYDGDTETMEKEWSKNLTEKAEKYSLSPVSIAMFGGVWDYNKMGFVWKKTMGPFKMKLQEAGFEEIEPGRYDTRNWEEIRQWAMDLVQKVR